MLLLIWKYAFSIKSYSSCNSRIYLSQCKDSGATFKKNKVKRGKREKREGEKRTSVNTRRERPTSLKEINLEMNNGHMSEGE
jgi:hypothetical protein